MFLGHIIYSERVEVDSKKTLAVKNFPTQFNPTDIRILLRSIGLLLEVY